MAEEKEKIIQLLPSPVPYVFYCLTNLGEIYKWYSEEDKYYWVTRGIPR